MQFDLTTFVLEFLNFLVLVWLLKRFFYRPVLAVIEARRTEGAGIVAKAQALRREADLLKERYEAGLSQIDKDSAAARATLDKQVADERARRFAALNAEIAEERKRREALDARQGKERASAQERQAITLAARFAARLLDRLAGPDLEVRLADLALAELPAQAPDKLEALRTALSEPGASVHVVSAYALDAGRRAGFGAALDRVAGRALDVRFDEDPALKAGVCIMAGAWVLMANLRDELRFFAGIIDHGA